MSDTNLMYGMIVPADFRELAKKYQFEIETARHAGTIAQMDKTDLPNINMYGMPLSELLSKSISADRCCQTAIAVSLAIPQCEIIVANFRKRAAFYYKAAQECNDESFINQNAKNSKAIDTLEPTYLGAFIIAKGKDILQSGIKFKTKHGQFIIEPDKEYAIDTQFCEIMEFSAFSLINYPQPMNTIINEKLKKSAIWQALYAQREQRGKEYSLTDLQDIIKVASTSKTALDLYFSKLICADAITLLNRPCSRAKVFKEYNAITQEKSI